MTTLKVYEFTFKAIVFGVDEEDAKFQFDRMWEEGDFDNITMIDDWQITDTGNTEEI